MSVSRTSWAFRIAIAVAGLALIYFAISFSLAAAFQSRSPQVALRLAPFYARSLASTASSSLEVDQSPAAVSEARERARAALLREPMNAVALRALGLAATFERDDAAALRSFSLVSQVTSRDLPSQLWWIEREAAEGDLAGALSYYDQALRTSGRASAMLLPTLAQASADPLVADRLVPLLTPRPSYFRAFFIEGLDGAPDASGVITLGTRLLDRDRPVEHDLINRMIMRLGRDRNFDDAWGIFVWAQGGAPGENIVNGSFDQPSPFALFNWSLTQNEALVTEVLNRENSNSLYLSARSGGGLAARQLLRLMPGRYDLAAIVGDVAEASGDRPTIHLTCAQTDTPILQPVTFPSTPSSQRPLRATFSVAGGCRYQWLNLTANSSMEEEVRSWIDDITIVPTS